MNATHAPSGPEPRHWSAARAFPILVFGLITGAFSPIFMRLSDTGPVATGAVRMIGQLPVLLALILAQPALRKEMAGLNARTLWLLVFSGLFFAGDLTAWYWALTVTSVADATFLANLTPIFVATGSWLLLGERLSRNFAAGAVVAIAGSVVMMSQSWLTTTGAPHNFWGDASAILAASFYAGYVLTVAKVRKTVSTLTVMAVSGASTSIALSAIALWFEPVFWPQTQHGWLVIAGMVVIVQLCGQLLLALTLAHIPANLTALMFLFQPVIGAGMAWYLFGERISLIQATGVLFIVAGLEFARRSSKTAVAPPEP